MVNSHNETHPPFRIHSITRNIPFQSDNTIQSTMLPAAQVVHIAFSGQRCYTYTHHMCHTPSNLDVSD